MYALKIIGNTLLAFFAIGIQALFFGALISNIPSDDDIKRTIRIIFFWLWIIISLIAASNTI